MTADASDIVIDVYETYGRHALDDTAKPVITRNVGTDDTPKLVDHYKARLTGEIWKRSTHPFTAADVDAMPGTTSRKKTTKQPKKKNTEA